MYRIIPFKTKQAIVLLPEGVNAAVELSGYKQVFVQYGTSAYPVKLVVSPSIEKNSLLLSKQAVDYLAVPEDTPFYIKTEKNRLIIGPYIGILAALTTEELDIMITTLTSFLHHYSYIGGSVIAFALDGVKEKEETITGYRFLPDSKSWKKGTYPFPASLFSIAEASMTSQWAEYKKRMHYFQQKLGRSVFNYPHFSKWEMYNLLKEQFSKYLPQTVLYQSPKNLQQMLQDYQSVYLKPLNGRLGQSIYQVKKTKKGYVVRHKQKKKTKVSTFKTEKGVLSYLARILPGDGKYLIQQSLPLMEHERSLMDFRIMMAKDHQGQWQHTGKFARYGSKGSIVSNVTAGGRAELADIALGKVWNLNKRQISEVKQEVEKLCQNVMETIEAHGYHCGNIGIDIGISKDLSLYIIEINTQNPDPYIAMRAKKQASFYQTRYLNMMYAKKLAGF